MLRLLFEAIRGKARQDDGAVATEYGLVLVLVVLAIILAVTAFGFAVAGLIDQGTDAF